jgi:DNA-binding NarL/FixJ family response regulator
MSIRLVVIDGHTLCRHGLAQVVAQQPDLELVGGAPPSRADTCRSTRSTPMWSSPTWHCPMARG